MKEFHIIKTHTAIILLRFVVCALFIMHAIIRLSGDGMDLFVSFLYEKGIRGSFYIVWAITLYEIAGGLLLAAGKFRRLFSLGFILILIFMSFIFQGEAGWLAREHSDTSIEYSIALIAALIVIASSPHHGRAAMHK
ncbi:MAG: hypothetical protein ABS68_08480 [Niastella sp. SCN 39-18]|nr:DoxX family protein [Sphingobacteriales bacterium]ODT52600.1 MAG: hypothetical protein ABS68_08480 [Niastella sp. SCN 39-18]OJW11739.1 MAG: hypothetical protein BGO53_12545 [Sphingobacteriales bacterium 39-19]